MEGNAMGGDQFKACLDGAYSIADGITHNADDRSARYELEAVNCARRMEQHWHTCWPIKDHYAGDPKLCQK